MGRRRCAETHCRHAPRAHQDSTGCRLCSCPEWLDRKRHVWREQVADAWLLATEVWLLHREAVAIGYSTEEREFEEHHPRPRLADFMDAMRPGVPPDVLEELRKPCRCCEASRLVLDPSG
jgi:hypothetical protein